MQNARLDFDAVFNQPLPPEHISNLVSPIKLDQYLTSMARDITACVAVLHQFIVNEDFISLKLILSKVASAEITKQYSIIHKQSLLHTAVVIGNPDIVKILLDSGVEQSKRESDGSFPLHLLSECKTENRVVIANLLLQHSGKLDAVNQNKETPLERLMSLPGDDIPEDLVVFYIQNNARLSVKTIKTILEQKDDRKIWFIFLYRCAHGDVKEVKAMLEQYCFLLPGAYVNSEKNKEQMIGENFAMLKQLFKLLASVGAIKVTLLIFAKLDMALTEHSNNKHDNPAYDHFLETLYLYAHRFSQHKFLSWLETYYQADPNFEFARSIIAAETGDIETAKTLSPDGRNAVNILKTAAAHGHLSFVFEFIAYIKPENERDLIKATIESALQHHQLLFIANWHKQTSVLTKLYSIEAVLDLAEKYNSILFIKLYLRLSTLEFHRQAVIEKIRKTQNNQYRLFLLGSLLPEYALMANEPTSKLVIETLTSLLNNKENYGLVTDFILVHRVELHGLFDMVFGGFIGSEIDKCPLATRLTWTHYLLAIGQFPTQIKSRSTAWQQTVLMMHELIKENINEFSIVEIVSFFGDTFGMGNPLHGINLSGEHQETSPLQSHARKVISNLETCFSILPVREKVQEIRYLMKDFQLFKPSNHLLNKFIAVFFSFHEQLTDEDLKKFLTYFYQSAENPVQIDNPEDYLNMLYYIKHKLQLNDLPVLQVLSSEAPASQLERLRDNRTYVTVDFKKFIDVFVNISKNHLANIYFIQDMMTLVIQKHADLEQSELDRFIDNIVLFLLDKGNFGVCLELLALSESTPVNVSLKRNLFLHASRFVDRQHAQALRIALESGTNFDDILKGINLDNLNYDHHQLITENPQWKMFFLNHLLDTRQLVSHLGKMCFLFKDTDFSAIFKKYIDDLLSVIDLDLLLSSLIKKEPNPINTQLESETCIQQIILLNFNLRAKYLDLFPQAFSDRCDELMRQMIADENISTEFLIEFINSIESADKETYMALLFMTRNLVDLIKTQAKLPFPERSKAEALDNLRQLLVIENSNNHEENNTKASAIRNSITNNLLLNLCENYRVRLKKTNLRIDEKKEIAETLLCIVHLIRKRKIDVDLTQECLEMLDEIFGEPALNQAMDLRFSNLKNDFLFLVSEMIIFDHLVMGHRSIPEDSASYFNPELTNVSEADKKSIKLITRGILAYRYLVDIADKNDKRVNELQTNICRYYLTANDAIHPTKSENMPWHPYAISLMQIIYPQSPELQLQIKMATEREFISLTRPLPVNVVPANAALPVKRNENPAQNWAGFLAKQPIARGKVSMPARVINTPGQ